MGDLVDLAEYKKKKEQEEIEEIQEDIESLYTELKQMIDEMNSPLGKHIYQKEWFECLPSLLVVTGALDTYMSGSSQNDE